APDELGHHADGHRLLLRRREEDERVDELVPRQREGEDPGREDAGHGDREDDPHHRAEARRAVDPRALLELLGDRLEIPQGARGVRADRRNVGYVRISAHGVSPTWKVRMMFASGMKRSVGGTRYVTKIDVPRVPAMGNRSRASAYPARSPQKSEIGVEVTPMNRVFHSQCGK